MKTIDGDANSSPQTIISARICKATSHLRWTGNPLHVLNAVYSSPLSHGVVQRYSNEQVADEWKYGCLSKRTDPPRFGAVVGG